MNLEFLKIILFFRESVFIYGVMVFLTFFGISSAWGQISLTAPTTVQFATCSSSPTLYSGEATYYQPASPPTGVFACTVPYAEAATLNGDFYDGNFCAITYGDYDSPVSGAVCGACVQVIYNGVTVVAPIVDRCACLPNYPYPPDNHIDLSTHDFINLTGGTGAGEVPITWNFVQAPASILENLSDNNPNQTITYYFDDGEDSGIFFYDTLFPLSSVTANGVALTRGGTAGNDGHWQASAAWPTSGSMTVVLTDSLGAAVTTSIPLTTGSDPCYSGYLQPSFCAVTNGTAIGNTDVQFPACNVTPETPTFTITPTNTETNTATRTATNTSTMIATGTNTTTSTPTVTYTWTNSATTTATRTSTTTPIDTNTNTTTNTATNTVTATETFTLTDTITSGGNTSTTTDTPSDTWTNTFTNTITQTATGTSSDTAIGTITNTTTQTVTASFTPGGNTSTSTNTPSLTGTMTLTQTPSDTPSPTFTLTDTSTFSVTPTDTFTLTGTPSNTQTVTDTFTPTFTSTMTDTLTNSPTLTDTRTRTWTPTSTLSATSTSTATPTPINQVSISPIYPNPVSVGPVNIDVTTPGAASIRMDVFTLAFRKIDECHFMANSGSASGTVTTVQWDLRDKMGENVANGLYYVRISVTGLASSVKILKLLVLK